MIVKDMADQNNTFDQFTALRARRHCRSKSDFEKEGNYMY